MKDQRLDVEVEINFIEKSLGFSKELAIAIAKSKVEFIQFLQDSKEARE